MWPLVSEARLPSGRAAHTPSSSVQAPQELSRQSPCSAPLLPPPSPTRFHPTPCSLRWSVRALRSSTAPLALACPSPGSLLLTRSDRSLTALKLCRLSCFSSLPTPTQVPAAAHPVSRGPPSISQKSCGKVASKKNLLQKKAATSLSWHTAVCTLVGKGLLLQSLKRLW